MRRQKRRRTTRRRGLQNIGDVLATILTDLEQDDANEQPAGRRVEQRSESSALPIASPTTSAQNTFAFYQPAEV